MPGYRHYNLKDDEFSKYDLSEEFQLAHEKHKLYNKRREYHDLFLAILLNLFVVGILIALIIDL